MRHSFHRHSGLWNDCDFAFYGEGIRPVFGTPGGKKWLAKTLVSLIPPHKVYVEPFIGGGAVYFAKRPSEKEAINDKDPDISFVYSFLKQMSEPVFGFLKRCNWRANNQVFQNLRHAKPSNPIERFRRFLYLRRFSYGCNMRQFDAKDEAAGRSFNVDKLLRVTKRLGNTDVFNESYETVVQKYDSPETFFYLDPPYPKTYNLCPEIPMEGLRDVCKGVKGKFLLSLNDLPENRRTFGEFHISGVKVSNQFAKGGGGQSFRQELLISNYPLKKYGEYSDDAILDLEMGLYRRFVEGYDPFRFCPEDVRNTFAVLCGWFGESSDRAVEGKIRECVRALIRRYIPVDASRIPDAAQETVMREASRFVKKGMILTPNESGAVFAGRGVTIWTEDDIVSSPPLAWVTDGRYCYGITIIE